MKVIVYQPKVTGQTTPNLHPRVVDDGGGESKIALSACYTLVSGYSGDLKTLQP